MNTPRYYQGCSVINNTTVVVAGDYGDYYAGTSSELLDLRTMTWSTGPELPEDVFLARMVGNILIGKKKIYKLEEVLTQRKQWRWNQGLEMTDTREYAQAFVVDKNMFQNIFCKN